MTVRIVLLLGSVLLIISRSTLLPAAEWYVDASVGDSGDGTTSTTAFKRIQEGTDAASEGDAVLVAEGVYVENIHFDGKNIILTSMNRLDPVVVANTIIDGSKGGSVVVFSGPESEACVLEGFTIWNGQALYGGGIGGGASDVRTHATIQNNAITDNSAEGGGGGLSGCDGTIQNDTIEGNSADMAGGGAVGAGTIPLTVIERHGLARHREPVTSGVPFPKGELRSVDHVRLLRDGKEVPAQFRVTGRWLPDESIRWLLVDFQAELEANAEQTYILEYGPEIRPHAKPAAAIRIEEGGDTYSVNTGVALFSVNKRAFDIFQEVRLADGTLLVPRWGGLGLDLAPECAASSIRLRGPFLGRATRAAPI